MMKKKLGLTVGALVLVAGTTLALAGGKGYNCDREQGEWGKQRHGGGYGDHAGGKGSMMGPRMLQMLDWELELSDQQRDQIRELMKAHQDSMAGQRSHMQLHRAMRELDPASADYQQQVKELAEQQAAAISQRMVAHAQTYADIYAVLTPEQQQLFKAMRDKKAGKRGGMGDKEGKMKHRYDDSDN